MVTLFCVIVGAKGNAFPVDIEASKSVGHLKEAIQKKKEKTITCDPDELKLFLAKKGDAWLNKEGAAAAKLDEERQAVIEDENGRPQRCEHMEETSDVVDYFGEDFKRKRREIHVLVVVPPEEAAQVVAEPIGPQVDLGSCDNLLAFLEGEMTNKEAIVSRPHILAQERLEFRLLGREQAIDTASMCFKNIIAHARSTASDRIQVVMPVCSGISGLGKTRMLEEGGTILELMKLDPKHVVRVIVPYFNGFSPQSVEQSMPIEASFSWRLLHLFFSRRE